MPSRRLLRADLGFRVSECGLLARHRAILVRPFPVVTSYVRQSSRPYRPPADRPRQSKCRGRWRITMARVSAQDCLEMLPNHFALCILGAKRARELAAGSIPTV